MNKPYAHLAIPFKVKPNWMDHFDDAPVKQCKWFAPTEILEEETILFFDGLGLEVVATNIWSWLKLSPSIWHIDQTDPSHPTVAFNFLLKGSSGFTQWIDESKVKKIVQTVDPEYGTADIRYSGYSKPDFEASLIEDCLMMIRNDIPHRVDRRNQSAVRWTIRTVVREKNSSVELSWDRALEIFNNYQVHHEL